MLDQQEQLYTIAQMCAAKPPSPSFFILGKAFTQLRRVTPWLREMPYAPVRYTLKHRADAWQRYFKGQGGRPRFKKRGNDSVTLPQDVRIEGGKLYFPKLGWMRLARRGGNPYPDGRPVSATVKRVCGKWYATVCYATDAVERPDDGTVCGVDMNVGQVAVSDGRVFDTPDSRRLEARMKRYQRRLARQRRGSRRRERTRPAARADEASDRLRAAQLAAPCVPLSRRRHGRTRGSPDRGDDGKRQGHGRGAGHQRAPEGRAQPGDTGNRVGRPACDACLQGSQRRGGGPGLHQPDLR